MTTQKTSMPVPADPAQWSEASRRSVSSIYVTEYVDIHYQCWHCKVESIYSAVDQKHTFEVKKADINQRRLLCNSCWNTSNRISLDLESNQEKWMASKAVLKKDKAFLTAWLNLLEEQETYVPYRHDTARKNMLHNLLRDV